MASIFLKLWECSFNLFVRIKDSVKFHISNIFVKCLLCKYHGFGYPLFCGSMITFVPHLPIYLYFIWLPERRFPECHKLNKFNSLLFDDSSSGQAKPLNIMQIRNHKKVYNEVQLLYITKHPENMNRKR